MDPPSCLLDKSFLVALADVDDPNHNEAKESYRSLIDDFVAQRCLLVARADHLASVDSPQLFAAVDKLHVAGQHRHAAEKMVHASDIDLDLDLAITLVLIRRCKLRKVVSFDERFAGYDITLIEPVTSPVEHSESVEN